jgi:hypothetical protein
MPVDIVADATTTTDVSGETIQLIVASTGVNDAGSAAGTVVYAVTSYGGILDSSKVGIGSSQDSSFAFVTGAILTTEVNFPSAVWEKYALDSRADKMATVGTLLSNGEYVVDYRTGLIIGKKATTGTSDTANYGYRSTAVATVVAGTVTVDSEFPAAAAITDNFANPSTTSVMAMTMGWDGAAWDRISGDATNGLLVNLGTNNDVTLATLPDTAAGDLASINALAATIDADTSSLAGCVGGTELQVDAVTLPVSYSAGADDATTQRVILATDDPAVALLTTVDADTSALAGCVGGSELQVDVVSSALPTGAATEATLATIDADTSSLAGCVAGSELQVDVVAALPAGTNAIGKLAANSGVDIGDVDVTSVPSSIQGPGNPTIDSYTSASISTAANTANQVLVSSSASKQIWVYGINFTVGTGDGTVSFQDEDDTAITGVMPFASNGGMVVAPSGNFAMPLWKLGTNKDLEVDTVTCDIEGSIQYAIVSV